MNSEITAFLNHTAGGSSYDHEVAYGYALDHRGDATFQGVNVPTTVLRADRRIDFERAVRDGQMDTAARIIGIGQFAKIRTIVQKLAVAINS